MTTDLYLWDKSGPPDPFVVQLERLLAGKRARVRQVGRARRLRILRVVGSVCAATAAAVAMWMAAGRMQADPDAPPAAPAVAIESAAPADLAAECASEATRAAVSPARTAESLGSPDRSADWLTADDSANDQGAGSSAHTATDQTANVTRH